MSSAEPVVENKHIFIPSSPTVPEVKEFCQIDLGIDPRLQLSKEDLQAVFNYAVYDENGNRHTMGELSAEFKTIFVFIRSLLCFTSQEYVEDLALIPKQEFKDKQVRLVVIGCAHWKHIKAFRRLTKFPYLMFCDIDYDIYNRLSLTRNNYFGNPSDSCHVKSSNWSGFFKSAKRAIGTSAAFDYQGRFDQQGATLIVGPGSVIHFFSRDQHARDHCPINQILEKVGIAPITFNQNSYLKGAVNAL